jgi:hypothetical protein
MDHVFKFENMSKEDLILLLVAQDTEKKNSSKEESCKSLISKFREESLQLKKENALLRDKQRQLDHQYSSSLFQLNVVKSASFEKFKDYDRTLFGFKSENGTMRKKISHLEELLSSSHHLNDLLKQKLNETDEKYSQFHVMKEKDKNYLKIIAEIEEEPERNLLNCDGLTNEELLMKIQKLSPIFIAQQKILLQRDADIEKLQKVCSMHETTNTSLNVRINFLEDSIFKLRKSLNEINDFNSLLVTRNEKCEKDIKLFSNATSTKYVNLVRLFTTNINDCVSNIKDIYVKIRQIKPNLNSLPHIVAAEQFDDSNRDKLYQELFSDSFFIKKNSDLSILKQQLTNVMLEMALIRINDI